MADLLSNVTTIFTSAMQWSGAVGTAVADNPLLLLGAVVPFVGLGIGLFKRLLHV